MPLPGFLRDGMEDDRLVYFLASMNVPYNGICTYMSHGGSLNTVMENPFILYRYGVSFLVCDRMAARFGQDPWAFERLDALVRHAVSRMKHGGHTRMEYDKMVEWICAYGEQIWKEHNGCAKRTGRNRSLLKQFHSALSGRRNDVCDGPDAF